MIIYLLVFVGVMSGNVCRLSSCGGCGLNAEFLGGKLDFFLIKMKVLVTIPHNERSMRQIGVFTD